MNLLLRKLRGVVGVGLTWAVGWSVLVSLIALVIGIVDPDSIDPGEGPLQIIPIIATVGFFSGAAFAGIVAFAEDRKRIVDLSLVRAGIWGILGAAALTLLTGINDAVIATTCPLGAIFSVGSVAIARRQARREADNPKSLLEESP